MANAWLDIEVFLVHTHSKPFVSPTTLTFKLQRTENSFNSVYLAESSSELDLASNICIPGLGKKITGLDLRITLHLPISLQLLGFCIITLKDYLEFQLILTYFKIYNLN